jgi:hypothetical protein
MVASEIAGTAIVFATLLTIGGGVLELMSLAKSDDR